MRASQALALQSSPQNFSKYRYCAQYFDGLCSYPRAHHTSFKLPARTAASPGCFYLAPISSLIFVPAVIFPTIIIKYDSPPNTQQEWPRQSARRIKHLHPPMLWALWMKKKSTLQQKGDQTSPRMELDPVRTDFSNLTSIM